MRARFILIPLALGLVSLLLLSGETPGHAFAAARAARAVSIAWRASAPDFTLIALPDTQYYTLPGAARTFEAQTRWVVENRERRRIAFVTHLGDITEHGNNNRDESEWRVADAAFKQLEAAHIPYGIVPGNHDLSGGSTRFEKWMGAARFEGRSYYGGHYGADNTNNFALFSAGGMRFIFIHLGCLRAPPSVEVLSWADALLRADAARRGVVVCHTLFDLAHMGEFSPAGQAVYDALKKNRNLFLMLGGHVSGQARRADRFDGHIIYSLLSDYQSYPNGGSGYLRIMEFHPARNQIRVQTYSPTLDRYQRDMEGEFELNYSMTADPVSFSALAETGIELTGLAWLGFILSLSGGAVWLLLRRA